MIKSLTELKAFLKPGVNFKITHAPFLKAGEEKLREVTGLDEQGVRYKDPDPDLALADWNKGCIAWRDEKAYAFDQNAFYFVVEPTERGQTRAAFRCEYVTPIPT